MTHPILITGAAGFIGFHTAQTLLKQGKSVVGIDNINDYYDVSLKEARLAALEAFDDFTFIKLDIADKTAMEALWAEQGPFVEVIHLAAQPGVRYSLENPYAYVHSNCVGHLTVLEMCRHTEGFKHLVYASSSSVYGANTKLPFSVDDEVNHPSSLYAATKKSDELMSHSYSHIYGIAQTGLRFFTVYGPWGRPDMAPFLFTDAILKGQEIKVFNHGDMKRDFTYIDDIVSGIIASLGTPPTSEGTKAPHRVLNIGNNKSEKLMDFIATIEEATNKKAVTKMMPMQDGDVKETYADIEETTRITGYKPTISIQEGIPKFVSWFKEFYGL